MAELTAADVQTYTGGRLSSSDPETVRMLSAALAESRKYCGWRVTPAAVETLTLDGPGSRLLSLPTMCLVELQAITDDGTTLDVTNDVYVSRIGLVRKKAGGCWSWKYGSIAVTMNHGDNTATDFQAAVLELIDRMSLGKGMVAGNSGPLTQKSVDDVTYEWAMPYQAAWDMLDKSILNPYRIEPL